MKNLISPAVTASEQNTSMSVSGGLNQLSPQETTSYLKDMNSNKTQAEQQKDIDRQKEQKDAESKWSMPNSNDSKKMEGFPVGSDKRYEIRVPPSVPGGSFDSYAWVTIEVFANKQSNTLGRYQENAKGDPLGTFRFLLGDSFVESTNHEWEEYSTPISEATQKLIDGLNTTGNAALTSVQGGYNLFKTMSQENFNDLSRDNINKMINDAARSINETTVASFKFDQALMFKTSQRRSISLSVKLALFDYGSSNGKSYAQRLKENIIYPVIALQWFSSARAIGAISLEFPALFRVTVGNITAIETAFCTSVQPNWNGPWINGYPSSCDLTLDFQSLEPTYKDSFKKL